MNKQTIVATLASLLAATVGCGSSKLAGGDGTGGSPGTGGATDTGGTGGTVVADGGYARLLAEAQAAWAAAKKTCPVYRYQTQVSSVFGFCSTTTVEIANDQPISRSFVSDRSFCTVGSDAGAVEQWSETTAADVGTHADGAPARTGEQINAACGQILASDPSKYEISYRPAANGLPLYCNARLINCVDDCTDGIVIPVFECEHTD